MQIFSISLEKHDNTIERLIGIIVNNEREIGRDGGREEKTHTILCESISM